MSFLGGGGWLSKGKHSFNITSLYNSSPAFIFLCMNGAWAKNGGKSKDLNLKCLTQHAQSCYRKQQDYNPGQNVLGHLRKLGTKMHFAKLTHILPLRKAWGCCYKGLFLLSPSPPSSVDCVEVQHCTKGEGGEGRCLNLTSYRVSVPTVLIRVVVPE